MKTWRLRWPIYRIYGNDYGDFLGIWFQWPIWRKRTSDQGFGSIDDFSDLIITWPDVTPRDSLKWRHWDNMPTNGHQWNE